MSAPTKDRSFAVLLIGMVITTIIQLLLYVHVSNAPLHANLTTRLEEGLSMTLVGFWMLGFMVWTAAVHAKKRWPHISKFSQRLGAMVAFDAAREDRLALQWHDGPKTANELDGL